MPKIEQLNFLTDELVKKTADRYGSPVYVYSEKVLIQQAKTCLKFPAPYGLTVRFAMKSNSNAAVLKTLSKAGLKIDASSGHEAERAMLAGIVAPDILLTTQELPENVAVLMKKGVKVNASSLAQLDFIGTKVKNAHIGLRINPGLGSGSTNRTNVGGPASSFGIWHEDLDEARYLINKNRITVERLHTHIGSGSDPKVWQKVALMSLKYVALFPEVIILNMGGGYKVARIQGEKATDLLKIGVPVKKALIDFYKKTGRKIHLAIEPGTFLTANSGAVITRVIDVVSTGKKGFNFIKTNSGMTEVLRPGMYGAQHPLVVVPNGRKAGKETADYIVTGHCCESGDILTPAPGDPEGLKPRKLKKAQIGDYLVIEGSGGYCSAMSTSNYNSYPEAAEVLLTVKNQIKLIRKRQSLKQVIQNEVST